MTLKDIRMSHGMSGIAVARAAGITEPLYSMMETGKRSISVKSAKRLAEVFGIAWHEIYDLNEKGDADDAAAATV